MEYLAANWLPLLISLIIGFILAWLFVAMPASRKRAEAEKGASDLQSKLSASNRSLDDSKKEADGLRQQLASENKTLTEARGMSEQQKSQSDEQSQQLTMAMAEIERLKSEQSQQMAATQSEMAATQSEMAAAQSEMEQLKATLQHKDEVLADANAKLAGPIHLFEQVAGIPADAVSVDHLTAAKAPAIIAGIMGGIKTKITQEVQELSLIPGIGTASEGKLYEAGIGTYWEVANMTDEELNRIIAPNAAQRATLDFAQVRIQALQLAQSTNTVGAIWNARSVDDFDKIPGISSVFEMRLYSAGISTYKDLANTTIEQLSEVCRPPSTMMPNYAAWIMKAKELAVQKEGAA